MRAGDGDATLNAPGGNITLIAGAGDDTFNGGNGNDTFVYAQADGNLTINNQPQWNWNSSDTATLSLTDLKSGDVTVAQQNNDLLIAIAGTGKAIDIAGEFDSGGQDGIAQVQFADGTSWSRTDITQRTKSQA